MEPEGTCSAPGCNAPIWWGITELNARMPLDPTPWADGRVIRVTLPSGKVRLHVLTGPELPYEPEPTDDVGPYRAHHQTCKNPDAFRDRPRTGGRRPARRRGAYACTICGGPMNKRATDAEGTDTHPCCDPRTGPTRVPARVPAGPPPPDTLDIPEPCP